MRDQTIYDDILSAFTNIGLATLHLSQIYEEVKTIRKHRGVDIGKYYLLKSYIRWNLEHNSRGEGKDIFIMHGNRSGIWSLKLMIPKVIKGEKRDEKP